MIENLPPGMVLILGALLVPLLRGRVAALYMLALPVLGLAQLLALPDQHGLSLEFLGYELQPVRVDRLSRIFGIIFHLAAFLSVLYSLHVKDRIQQVSGLAYAGAGIGAVFAGDLITLFVYWELTAITSVFLIWASRTEAANRAGLRYLVVQVLSGVLLLAGAIMHYEESGSLAFGHLGLGSTGTQLIFLGFGIKAAFPLLHNWLQDAYPQATPTGTVFLSAFTTKLAIYALARGYAGTDILIPIGAAMTAFPIFFAVLENDLRRVLAYSLNNQLGFMVVGVGIGTELAINGTAAHAFAHILYKALLFMTMGAVLHRTGTTKATDLGGLYKSMPWTTFFCLIGAASISAFPLFSGFVSKSMILTAAAEEHHLGAFLVLLFASAGVLHHSGIKIPFYGFFGHDRGLRTREAPWNMLLAMGGAAALCVGLGIWYEPLYALLPFSVDFVPYNMTHVVTQLQLLFFALAAFIFMYKAHLEPPEIRAIHLDSDWFYRRAGKRLVLSLGAGVQSLWASLTGTAVAVAYGLGGMVARAHKPGGPVGEPLPSGKSALWAALLLFAFLTLALFFSDF
ncbi:MAG: Na(+)/H(+) antiporter subunit D [Planctomycetes bacterium]|nr:Na(+)/H(+) antiporter subunit D [Planctomycetota bacterium]HJM58125.1 Na(+)/H(+) antiporter subunit D [Planctomycetota bacterium]